MAKTPDWQEVGRRIRAAREAKSISARSAAHLAPMSATYWQDIERGGRIDGGRFNPSAQKLLSAARVVGLNPGPLFALVGRPYKPVPASDEAPPIAARLDAIETQLAEQGALMSEILRAVKAADRRLRDQGIE